VISDMAVGEQQWVDLNLLPRVVGHLWPYWVSGVKLAFRVVAVTPDQGPILLERTA